MECNTVLFLGGGKWDNYTATGGAVVKNPSANAGNARNTGSIPESGRSPGIGNDNPLEYYCLDNL